MTKSLGLVAFVMIFALQAGSASAKQWCTKSKINNETVCRTTSDGTGFRPKRPVFVPGQATRKPTTPHTKAGLAVIAHRNQSFMAANKAMQAVLAHKQLTAKSHTNRSRLH